MLWLDPNNPDTFPEGLLDALSDAALSLLHEHEASGISMHDRLRAQMRADALQPVVSALDDSDSTGSDAKKTALKDAPFSPEIVEEASRFLRASVRYRRCFCKSPPDVPALVASLRIDSTRYCPTFAVSTGTVFGVAPSMRAPRR